MTISIGQVSFNLFPAEADPGQIADNGVNHIVGFVANETIHPGRLVEIASDGSSIQEVQQTGSTLSPVGVALLMTAQREGTGNANSGNTGNGAAYSAGEKVPVLRRGAVFAEWKGTTQTGYASPNAYHSSTTAADRGKLTDATTSTVAGSEIAACPNTIQLRKARTGSGNIALVEVNMPGAAS